MLRNPDGLLPLSHLGPRLTFQLPTCTVGFCPTKQGCSLACSFLDLCLVRAVPQRGEHLTHPAPLPVLPLRTCPSFLGVRVTHVSELTRHHVCFSRRAHLPHWRTTSSFHVHLLPLVGCSSMMEMHFASLYSVHTAGYIVLIRNGGWIGGLIHSLIHLFVYSFSTAAVTFFVRPWKRRQIRTRMSLAKAVFLRQHYNVLVLLSLLAFSKW